MSYHHPAWADPTRTVFIPGGEGRFSATLFAGGDASKAGGPDSVRQVLGPCRWQPQRAPHADHKARARGGRGTKLFARLLSKRYQPGNRRRLSMTSTTSFAAGR